MIKECYVKNNRGVPSVDVRYEGIPRGAHSKFKKKRGIVVKRNPSQVNGIVLHQTAINYVATEEMLEESQWDEQLALARRVKRVACHALSFDGFFVKTYPLAWYVSHANYLNKTTLGLEVEGRYEGILGDPSTLWKGKPTKFTKGRLEAACAALSYLVEEGRNQGMPIRYIYAHRQAKSNRRSDPGEELWRKVALEHGFLKLGLESRMFYSMGDGRPIPTEWDKRAIAPY